MKTYEDVVRRQLFWICFNCVAIGWCIYALVLPIDRPLIWDIFHVLFPAYLIWRVIDLTHDLLKRARQVDAALDDVGKFLRKQHYEPR